MATFLTTMRAGLRAIQSNQKLLFLVVLLVLFPLLFVVVLERFYDVATANIETAEGQRLGALHDAVVAVLLQDPAAVQDISTALAAGNPDVRQLQIYTTKSDGTLVVEAAMIASLIGPTTTVPDVLTLAAVTPGETVLLQQQASAGRITEAVRSVATEEAQYTIYSRHYHSAIDGVLSQRKQDAYLVLSFIFIFMVLLAYWIQRQTDWQRRYEATEATLAARDLLTNQITHEFRTPLTAIKGYASFLQESDTMTKEEQRFATTIRDSAERLVRLVNDFLEIARMQAGKLRLEWATVDLNQAIQTVIADLEPQAAAKQLELVYQPADAPVPFYTDQARFTQIVTNLLSNAIKYTDTGSVTITLTAARRELTLSVSDTGRGISASDQAALFTPFARVGNVDTTTIPGTGLGLAITKQLTELLGGTISVESIEGVGTKLVVRFRSSH